MRVLVTGGAGFIGSHLVTDLLSQGHAVTVIDDFSTGSASNLGHLTDNPAFQLIEGSVLDRALMVQQCHQHSLVVHLAAAVGVKLVLDAPLKTIETNVLGTHTVLSASLDAGCRLLLASTSEIYGKGNGSAFRETDDRVMGQTSILRWSYAASKAIDETLVLAAATQYEMPGTCSPSAPYPRRGSSG